MSALSTRSDSKDLPPFDPKGVTPSELLVGEAERAVWRIVELFSAGGQPFDAEVHWSSGSGAGAHALLTVAHAARLSIFARSVRVMASNLSHKSNRVGVTVSDGFATTHNQREHRSKHTAGTPSRLFVPPFAHTVRFDLADPALAPLATLRVLDGLEEVMASYPLHLQPQPGIPVGGASGLDLDLDVDVAFRAVYHLSL